MGLTPDTKIGKIEFCEEHVTPFTDHAVAIGTTVPTITAWSALVAAARAKYEAQKAAQNAARSATIGLDDAIRAMMNATAPIIKQIRAKADVSGNSIYEMAELPAPATPTPMGPLGEPRDFKVTIDKTSGALELTWKNTNPKNATGVVYQIFRSYTPADADYEYLGGVGSKKFTDSTIAAGSAMVFYKIQAVRSTSVGPWALCVVKFGVGSGATVTTLSQPKMAA